MIARLLRHSLLFGLVFGLVWLTVIIWWQQTNRVVSAEDVIVWMLVVPVALLASFFLLRWDYRVAARPQPKPAAPPFLFPEAIEKDSAPGADDAARALDKPLEAIDKDGWAGNSLEFSSLFLPNHQLKIKYINGSEKRTERIVEARQLVFFGYTIYLIGHCHLRNAKRMFRVDRIQSCIDVETGEIVTDVREHLQLIYEQSIEKTMDVLLKDELDTLRVLLYVGKACSQLRAAKKTVIKNFYITLSNDLRLTERSVEELFLQIEMPTLLAFKFAVSRLAKRNQSTRWAIMLASEKIVATHKSVNPAEKVALDYMKRKLLF